MKEKEQNKNTTLLSWGHDITGFALKMLLNLKQPINRPATEAQ